VVPWRELGRAKVGGDELVLARRGDEYAIRLRGAELMNSRSHASEEALARLACTGLARTRDARVLIGGLGMGFTARAALDALAPDARITIVELVPEVVAWNRDHLAALARRPLEDPRIDVRVGDVAATIGEAHDAWHAILLDVDNGPDAFTAPANAALYGLKGLIAARRALVKDGALGVWSVEDDKKFTDRLRGAGLDVERHRVPARPNSNVKHVIWIGRRPSDGDGGAGRGRARAQSGPR
jgi:spermidine synthase